MAFEVAASSGTLPPLGNLFTILSTLLYPVAWVLLHKAAVLMDVMPGVSTWFPPAGLTLAFLLRFPNFWPMAYLGVGFVVALDPYPAHPVAILLSWLVSPTCYTLGAALLRRLGGEDFDLARPRPVLLLIAAAAAIPAVVGSLNVAVFCFDGIIPWSAYSTTVLRHMIGDGLGILSVAPLLLLWRRIPPLLLRGKRGWLLAGCTLAALAILQIEVSGALLGFERNRLSYLVMLPIAVNAALFGIGGAALSAFVVNAAISSVALFSRDMPLAADSPYFMLSVAALALIIGSLNEARGEAARRLAAQRRALDSAFRQIHGGEPALALIHDLKQPLASIASYAQGLKLQANSGSHAAEAADAIAGEVQRLAGLLEQARTGSGVTADGSAGVTFDTMLQDLAPLLERIAAEHNALLSIRRDAANRRVLGNAVALQKAVVNLVENACEAVADMPGGRRRVDLATHADDGLLHFTVDDSGPGFPAELLARGHAPFVSGKTGGSGIGLAIVHEILDAAGGRFEFQNRPRHHPMGEGARAICRLPVIRGESDA